ncbi:MAG: conjugal transfer pilus assembly protein TrbC [Candidatus Accumulibacter appositus]|uniref:Conjugal transfer pilus assembly protein TrbC n=1 Tax=Candidatus Accumulibacter appositus TaxID=1454003 RepID=A0A011QNT7_9PROT|nr:type-F conjugative transfer system pilin assembly protein TrbC [Accumulibacter sp.]EXI80484.1 MAG: conjugal transfer pilus assembly protein TrbC [Candidatus Accumulibacter appositus]HRF06473.1 type-F conjugative transfer system pilin assembly protein TrbC [Accumulibacter sp.]
MWASELHPSAWTLGLTAALVASAQALAQNPPVITDADIERVRREQPAITDQDIDAARRKYGMPSDAELRSAPVPTRPNVEALPQPLSRPPIDLEALARGYASQSEAMTQAQGLATGPGLLVFVSLSMPRPTLQRLVDQAARAKASIVLRGFANGSLRDTVAQVQGLIGSRQVAMQIDPQAFDRYAVTRVPTFVLVRDGTRPVACASGSCAPADSFLRTSGDVSLDYALEHMRRSAPGFGPPADTFLKRIKG